MTDVEALRDRLVGQRFYDSEQEEAFTVVGVRTDPPLALLQYDDGVAWDEGTSHFALSDDVATHMRLDPDGLDSERYRQLGPGPRLDQICEPDAHDWYPEPDTIWPDGPPASVQTRVDNPQDTYNRLARCKRCGLSGDVAEAFGTYSSEANTMHTLPWFCALCDTAVAGSELVFREDLFYCPDCASDLDDSG